MAQTGRNWPVSDRPQSGSVGLEPIRELGNFVHRSHSLVVVLYICDRPGPADVTSISMLMELHGLVFGKGAVPAAKSETEACFIASPKNPLARG